MSSRPRVPGTPLSRSFFERSPEIVAQAVLGLLLVRITDEALLVARIVEVEAYFGEGDPAAHAAAGRTTRNAVLFGPAGHAYVYFIYGMYNCLNISCEPESQAGCVLVRALEPMAGLEQMARNRKLSSHTQPRLLTGGPGRLCQALDITRAGENGLDLLDPHAPLQLRNHDCEPAEIVTAPRIGISKATDRPLRFFLADHPCVSGPIGNRRR